MIRWHAIRWSDHGIGLLLCVVWFSVLASTSSSVGIPRDESFYLYAADQTAGWYERLADPKVESFSKAEIDRGFKYNHEHPVLMKTLFGLSHLFLHKKWGLIEDQVLAYRVPTIVMASLAIWLAWLLGIMIHGRIVGLVAALALAFMPRVFFHSHLACFDGPVTFMWLAGVYTFIRATVSRRWALACGFTLGLGLATKLNIFFLPFTLLVVALVDLTLYKKQHGRWTAEEGMRGPITYYSWIAGSMVVLGLAVFFVHWPWLYYETIPRLRFYVGFHAKHVHYPVDYLGHLYFRPPFPMHFPFLMTLWTVPVGILVLGGIGFSVMTRRVWLAIRGTTKNEDRLLDLVMGANLLVPILVIALPQTPIFGGTKHWMPAMPFLAVCAGIGAVRLGQGMWSRFGEYQRQGLTIAVACLMLAPAAWATFEYGAHGPAYYNGLIGGPPGAAAKGLPRNFWGYSTVDILEAVNKRTEKGAHVFWHKATRGAIDTYKKTKQLRKDVRYTGDWTAAYSDWAVYHDQMEKLPEEVDIWRAYGQDWPVDGYFVDGVQLMALYKRGPRRSVAQPRPPNPAKRVQELRKMAPTEPKQQAEGQSPEDKPSNPKGKKGSKENP